MRTITHSEFVNGAGEGVYVSHVHYLDPNERKAGDAACQRVVAPQAFTPFGHAGEPQDPPEFPRGNRILTAAEFSARIDKAIDEALEEPWPSDKDATDYTTEPASGGLTHMPPNCLDGGEYRAALQFESAAGDLNPDACRSGVCTTE
jgi:hypothetical protein